MITIRVIITISINGLIDLKYKEIKKNKSPCNQQGIVTKRTYDKFIAAQ
ncbi:hypothetical protein PEC301937_21590 [Pectobacterium carotovorum subsp. carotovorum]|nr:hypothetical protein PEC301937_21590 [Pectobacterium carotovorum subsp. carotovorum]